MNLENYAKMRGLQTAHTSTNSTFVDHLLAGPQGDEVREKILTKRLQFDTTAELYSEVERVCSLLECSKREFLEMAVCEAISRAESVFMATFEDATGQEFMSVFGVKEEA
jgi:hypothetical protein